MKALVVHPGVPHSAELIDVPPPEPAEGALLVKGRAIGICGTDLEIIDGGYGEAPPGKDWFVLGHESLGEVAEAPSGSGFVAGDLVVGVVRRRIRNPAIIVPMASGTCAATARIPNAASSNRMATPERSTRLDPEFAVRVDSRLGELGVLLEPMSVVAKACLHGMHILRRSRVPARTALITGAGPIGLLAALVTRQAGLETYVVDIVDSGPKPDPRPGVGRPLLAGSALDLPIAPDAVIECTGVGAVLREAAKAAPGAVIALTGISAAPSALEVDLNAFNKHMVLSNKVLFGSVNASRAHYEAAAGALASADPAWLKCLITRRVPIEKWSEVLERRPEDVKVVLEISAGG